MFGVDLDNLLAIVVITTFVYASYRDLVSREIPEVSWVPAYLVALLSVILRPPTDYSVFGIALTATPPIVYGVLFVLGLIGGADFLAILLVSLAHLREPLIPLLTFILSSVVPLPLAAANLLGNTTIYRGAMSSIKCVKGNRKVLYLVGKPITVSDFLKKKFAFLHTQPSEEGFICSSSVDVDVDFEKQKAVLLEALSRGSIKPEDIVVYSPALPHIVFIAFSYLIAVVIAPELRSLMPVRLVR